VTSFHPIYRLEPAADCKQRWRVGRTFCNRTVDENVNVFTKFSNCFGDKIYTLKRTVASETAALSTPPPTESRFIGQPLHDISVTPDEVGIGSSRLFLQNHRHYITFLPLL